MRGWLVYSQDSYDGNRWFAERLSAMAAEEGIDLALKLVSGDRRLPSGRLPDFAVMRAICPGLSAKLEAKGVRVFNNAETARVANDKWETFLLARELGIPVLDTRRFTLTECGSVRFPCVVKSLDGHGGSEVFFVRDASELFSATAAMFVTDKGGPRSCAASFVADKGGPRSCAALCKSAFIAQPLCDEPGIDMRVYMLGGEAIAAVRRTSKTDFRSNFKLGGKVASVDIPPDAAEMARRLYDRLKFDFAGVDFIRDGGRWIFNEIEDVVGTRMLYATTALDAAKLLMRHAAREGGGKVRALQQ